MELDVAHVGSDQQDHKLIALDEALAKLTQVASEKAELVKLRYFTGLTTREAAEAMGISTATADRYWAYARAWLQREMESTDSGTEA
jgi:RNA polymerase sigma factor (sigma-70 family)